MKKRLLSLILALCLLLTTPVLSPAALAEGADTDPIEFTPGLVNAVDNSSTEWYSSSTNRAMLTVLICLDMIQAGVDEDSQIDISKTTFVGKSDFTLLVAGWNNTGDKIVAIIYTPLLKTAYYSFLDMSGIDSSSSLVTDLLLEKGLADNCDSCYKNSTEDILTVVLLIQSYLDS